VFLGTPAFSSPEQLRGDELDVRSDIYSVGVTLYYLLTGQTPFQAKQMVQLLATVLERPAPSPRTTRSEVPAGLAKVVLRCLAKKAADRFKSYDELRQALLPYTSAAPTPGTLGFRFLASGIDFIVGALLAALLPVLWFRDFESWYRQLNAILDTSPQSPDLMLFSAIGMVLELTYFAVLEGIWGASVGKAICGLRVVGPAREAAGVPRALLRATIYSASAWVPCWGFYAFDPAAAIAASADPDEMTLEVFGLLLSFGLFCTMRRRNGYAGIHELASGTRVVRIPTRQQRPSLSLTEEPLPETQDARQIGPYHVLGSLDVAETHELLLAYDPRLLRKVWLRKAVAGTPPIPAELRELGRIGRLRWLNAGGDGDGPWDAFEAPPGKPLLSLIGDRQPWEAVRFWLLDLAEELSASLKDGPLPSDLELDRVWITADGRAKLLDFPAPGLDAEQRATSASPSPGRDAAAVRIFLKRVAIAALEGHVLSGEDVQGRDVAALLPLQARSLLCELDRPADAEIPTPQLKSFTQKPASVSPQRRAGVLAACWLPPLMFAAVMILLAHAERQFLRAHPQVAELSEFVRYYRSLENEGAQVVGNGASITEVREAIEIYVAGRFRSAIENRDIWSDPTAPNLVDTDGQRLLERFVEAHPTPSAEDVAKAESRLQWILRAIQEEVAWNRMFRHSMSRPAGLFGIGMFFLIVFVVVPSLISALIFRHTPLLRMLEIAVVTKRGAPASRLRVLWRSTVLWSIVLFALCLMISLGGRPRALHLFIIYGIATLFTAKRGLQDRIAGTCLVPR
jgi:uncharacterized RDD family membrane protein YckC